MTVTQKAVKAARQPRPQARPQARPQVIRLTDVEEAKSSRKSRDKHTQKKGKLNPDALSIFSSKEKQKGEVGIKNKANEENQVVYSVNFSTTFLL